MTLICVDVQLMNHADVKLFSQFLDSNSISSRSACSCTKGRKMRKRVRRIRKVDEDLGVVLNP